VAMRVDLPETIALRLARERNACIVRALAGNPACPPKALERLSGHPDPEVVELVGQNPNAPAVAQVVAALA